MKREQAAIALFARAPVLGQVKTRLAQAIGARGALALYLAFVDDCVARLARVRNIDRYLYLTSTWDEKVTPLPESAAMAIRYQSAGDLGARMQSAITELIADGYGRVLIVGTDSPDLPAGLIDDALAALVNSQCVIGPADDGGYYLIGVARACAPRLPILFENIAWSTEAVCSETLARARAAGISVACLPRWYDIDTVADLERLKRSLAQGRAECPRTRAVLKGGF